MSPRLQFTQQTEIPLPRAEAFDAFTDVTRFPEWQRAVRRVIDLQGSPTAAGSTYVLDHGIGGRATVTVLEVDRPSLYRAHQRALRTDMTITVRFSEAGPGAT